jgi:uncharacterized Fe-S radical SAM superfamily protein PflX
MNGPQAHRDGWLKSRVDEAIEELRNCKACPRDCGVNRLDNKTGACNTGNLDLKWSKPVILTHLWDILGQCTLLVLIGFCPV